MTIPLDKQPLALQKLEICTTTLERTNYAVITGLSGMTCSNMIALLKQRWQSRTYRAGLLMALLSILEVQSGFISQFLPPQYRPALIAAWPLVMFCCREITTSALVDK